MKKIFTIGLLPLLIALLVSGCSILSLNQAPTGDALLACTEDFHILLGDQASDLPEEDYNALFSSFKPLWKLRQSRINSGKLSMGSLEQTLMTQFSTSLDAYANAFYADEVYGEGVDYGYPDNTLYDLVDYEIDDHGSPTDGIFYEELRDFDYEEGQLIALWDFAGDFLPDGALDVFDYYSVFTDGEYGTTAYTYWGFDDDGTLFWGLALDPEDASDEALFQETLLHEYFHYLSLSEDQVTFGAKPTSKTYFETASDFVSHKDSYLNLFYQMFWPEILKDERIANPDSTDFFLRHYWSFYDDYASTDPTEDIAECFAFYVLSDNDWASLSNPEIWEQKIAWFDQFPELQEFRTQIQQFNNVRTA